VTGCHSEIPDPGMRHFTQASLAERWQLTVRTLERWRIAGTGPAWMKLNGRIRYRPEDVDAFERARLRQP
jgi:predicted site-specific integrase-resolvase